MLDSEGLRVAVVGYGYWGGNHVRVLNGRPDITVTVVDESEERRHAATQRHRGVRTAACLDDAIDDIDAVVVATPPMTHAKLALTALHAGRHVLVEKPLATSSAEAEEMVAQARKAGTVLMTGHTFEYNSAVGKLKEIVSSGTLGRVLYIDAARLSLGRYQPDVDVVWDLAPHDISILSFLLDELPSDVSVWKQRSIGSGFADVAYLRMNFARAATHAVVHLSWLDPCKVRRVTVVGDQRMAVYNDLSDNERIRIYDTGVDVHATEAGGRARTMPVTYRSGDIVSPYLYFHEPLQAQDDHFIECVRSGSRPRTPGERGLEILRVLEAADAAADSGRAEAVRDAVAVG
ncbi:Gfo/Idh/MocA family oxidoreductase [Actinomycetospora lutea]|uniref:Gfo/Idh/MocA family protein n=1 Tax=Actinomycetospora lutea TaxID=663604 RepID=UPI002366FA0D|nr:Gfo/Idh/MocA family oxidoreductase [Actinomycetospora lutea]MDD7942005.1 Gfo/Idh/MocA family oxidoreductase [Actinomycetospora lutea]